MRILVAIPVYNEQRHVTDVLGEVSKYARDILVVDDGSTDDTPILLARQPVEVVRHSRNRGYGRSLRDAFRWAVCYSYDWLITMDCDEQHEPAAIPMFVAEARRGLADVISGSRYLQTDLALSRQGQPPADRQAINQTITRMINERLGLSLTDAFCGFKAYRVPAIKKLDLTETGYAFPMQFWVQAVARNLRIVEAPVKLIYNDPNRHFGGALDDPTHRLQHYAEAFNRELARFPERFGESVCGCGGVTADERG
jgi:glycosyltransferase involved in cell wall biosynthesis